MTVVTGGYFMKLGNKTLNKKANHVNNQYPKLVEIVPIKREFTLRQIEDKTQEIAGIIGINYESEFELNYKIECERCGFSIDTNKMNLKEIDNETLIKMDKIDNEIRNKIRDQMDKKLLHFIRLWINNLKQDPLSQHVEIVFNNIITELRKSPQRFYKEQIKKLYNKDVAESEIEKLEVVEVPAENINNEKVEQMELHKITYSMKQGRATRRHNKSPHLSEQA